MKVPQREVLPGGPAAPFQRSGASAADFGGLQADALAKSGAEGMRGGEEMVRLAIAEQGLKNEAEAKDADIAATKRLTDLQYNPDTGFMQTKGKNAVDGFKTASEAAQQIRAETLAGLKNPEAKRMADRVLATRVQSTIASMASHTGVENRSWQLGTSDARAVTELDAASLEYNNDVRFDRALATARDEAHQQAQMNGWGGPDAPQTKLRIKQYEDAGWLKRYERWQQQDPAGALANFQRNSERIGPDLSAKLSESLFKAAAPVLAAQLNATGGAPVTASEIGKAAPGQVEPGNIELGKRPRVQNKDGTFSTIRSMSFNQGGQEILVPTLADDGTQLTEQQAIDAYNATGRHLGKFDTPANATAFAKRLSNDQGKKDTKAIDTPRGVRNNNPGNIILGPTKWQGEIDGSDPRYASFATPEDGIRALGKNLLAYGDRGITTVGGIINRWAPATENDTKAYTATVAKELGVDPQAPLNLRDRKILTQLAGAIIKVENGKAASAYTPEQIATGITAALEGKPIPTDPKAVAGPGGGVAQPTMVASIANMTATDVLTVQSGHPTIDRLPADQKIQVFHLARTQANQGIAQAREALKGRAIDSAAALERGMDAPTRPTSSELITVFGQYEGMKIDQELSNAAAFGNDVRTVGTMPLSQQAVLLAARAPQPGDGFAQAEKRHEQLARAIDRVNTERTQDPSLAVLRNSLAVQAAFKGLTSVPANADPAARAAASQAYAAATLAEQQRLEIQNPQVLPKSMVDQIAKQFATPPGEGQDTASVMRGIVDQWGKYWPMVGKQLGSKIPAGAVVIGLGVKPEAEQMISEALKLKPEQLRQGITPDDQKALKDLVTKQFEPLQRTLAWQAGGQETYDNFVDTADQLAVLLMQKGMKPKDAAAKAFESMAGFKYEFEETWRVPKTALSTTVTPNLLRGGAHAARFDVAEGAPLRIPSAPGAVRTEDADKQWRDTVRDNGFWVTSPGDGGLSLYVKSGLGAQPVLAADGRPVRKTWDELGQIGNSVRAARYADVYKKGVRGP